MQRPQRGAPPRASLSKRCTCPLICAPPNTDVHPPQTSAPKVIYRKDYQATPYLIDTVGRGWGQQLHLGRWSVAAGGRPAAAASGVLYSQQLAPGCLPPRGLTSIARRLVALKPSQVDLTFNLDEDVITKLLVVLRCIQYSPKRQRAFKSLARSTSTLT